MGEIVFGFLWMLLGILIISGFVNHNLLTPYPEPPRPQGLPDEILDMTVCSNVSALKVNDASAVIALGEDGIIQFDNVNSLEGLCGGNNAILIITSPSNVNLSAASLAAYWHGDLKDTYSSATPSLRASFQSDKFLHQWVSGRAVMDAIYPVRSTPVVSVFWENEQKHVERTFSFYVVTPEEAKIIQAHNNWVSEGVSHSDALWFGIPAIFIVFVLPGALLIRYAYRKRKYGTVSYRKRWHT